MANLETAGKKMSSIGQKGYNTHFLNMDAKAIKKEESNP